LYRVFCSALQTNLRKSALTSLDDLNARLLTLNTRLRQIEDWRDDTLKAADDPSAQTSVSSTLMMPPIFKTEPQSYAPNCQPRSARRRLLCGH
jgi:hypothetical protein